MNAQLLASFLRTVLNGYVDPTHLDKAATLVEQPDFSWPAVLAVAAEQGLLPLLYGLLDRQAWIPEDVRCELQQAYTMTLLRYRLLRGELDRLLRRLRAGAVPVLVLKGVALAETIYPDPAWRPMHDMDLLVPPETVPTVMALLAQEGYRPVAPEVAPGVMQAYESQIALIPNRPLPFGLELHWHLFDSPHHQRVIPMDWFWQTCRPLSLAAEQTRILGPEAQLLHLGAHLWLHHRGRGLLWQFDLVLLLHAMADRLDWDVIVHRAAAYDLILSTRHVLNGLATLWQAPVPPTVLDRLRTLSPSRAERRTVAHLTAARRPVLYRFCSDLLALPTWSARLRYAWFNLFPVPAYMRERYGISRSYLLPFYYPYRWCRAVREALRRPQKGE